MSVHAATHHYSAWRRGPIDPEAGTADARLTGRPVTRADSEKPSLVTNVLNLNGTDRNSMSAAIRRPAAMGAPTTGTMSCMRQRVV